MVGSPGAGKTLLARAMPGILPEMSIEESLGESLDLVLKIVMGINSHELTC
jgi:predicted ATPase with chaperone activity